MSRRSQFLALAAGAAAGLILGLVYTWRIAPVELYNTTPSYLRSDYRHDWIRMAALGYIADGDLERALARLSAFDTEELQTALAVPLIETYAAQGKPAETMRALSRLAEQLGVETPAMLVYLGTAAPSPTSLPEPTVVPSPSPIPSPVTRPTPTTAPTPLFSLLPIPAPYRVISQTLVCEGAPPQLQVFVQAAPIVEEGEEEDEEPVDEDEEIEPMPLAGVVLWLTWPGGADRAVTGLRLDIDPGYADFTLEPDIPYALSIDEPNAPLFSGLLVDMCPAERGSEPRPGTWRIVVEIEGQE